MLPAGEYEVAEIVIKNGHVLNMDVPFAILRVRFMANPQECRLEVLRARTNRNEASVTGRDKVVNSGSQRE